VFPARRPPRGSTLFPYPTLFRSCCASRTPATRLRAPASPAATRRWAPGSWLRASLLAGGGGQGPHRGDVLLELQALVAVGIERSQDGRILAGLHDQREACVFGAVEAAVVVPVELVELRAQSRGDAALDHALPALLELGAADHAIVVRIPGLEGLVHPARRHLRLCLGPCPGGQQQARDGGEQNVHCGAAACPA